MKEALRCIVVILILIGFAVGMVFACIADKKEADALYNNGVCPKCGTAFHLVDVEHYRNGGDHYFFTCENEHIIECKCRPSIIE